MFYLLSHITPTPAPVTVYGIFKDRYQYSESKAIPPIATPVHHGCWVRLHSCALTYNTAGLQPSLGISGIDLSMRPLFDVDPNVPPEGLKRSPVTSIIWLRPLVAGLSPRRPGLIHVRFVVDKVALGQVFLRVLRFSPVNISFHRRSPNSYHLGNA
jgi:hypothetical protein